MKRFHRIFLSALVLVLLLTGCDGNEDDTPTAIPPAAFQFQTDLFDTNPDAAKAPVHFLQAAGRVLPVSVLVGANLIIPAAITEAAFDADPVLEDEVWTWTATTLANNQEIQFTISAVEATGGRDWTAHVTRRDVATGETLDDFDLYTAQTRDNGTTGSWQLYYPQGGTATNVLNAEYTITSNTEKSITFSIPATFSQNAGDSVEYTENGAERTFLWTQASSGTGLGTTHLVVWNAETHAGSITASNYNNGEQACWDTDFQDTECPVAS